MKKNTYSISIILFLAFSLRILGIWHDYPYSFFGDEAHFVKRALSFGSLDFNPHWFHKPAFYMYFLFFEYGIFFVFGKIIGLWGSVSDFAVFYILNPGPFYLIGRITTALFGIATVYVVYLIGEIHFRKNAGLIGALLIALSCGHVVASQDVKADVPTAFFTILSMYYLLNYFADSRRKHIIFSAIFAGVGAATKYYSIVMLGPILMGIFLSYVLNTKPREFRVIQAFSVAAIALLSFWGAYFICSPFNFIDPLGRQETFDVFQKIIVKIFSFFQVSEVTTTGGGEWQEVGLFVGLIDYFEVLVSLKSMGYIISGISLLGFLFLLIKFTPTIFLFLMFPLLFVGLSIFTFPGYADSRHQLPIYPFLTIAGGVLVASLFDTFSNYRKMIICIVIVSLLWPISLITQRGYRISKKDTRNLAKIWIESNIPSDTNIMLDEFGPVLVNNPNVLENDLAKSHQADSAGQFTAHYDTYLKYQILASQKASVTYHIKEIRFPWWHSQEVQAGEHVLDSEHDRDMGNPLKKVGVNPLSYYIDNGYEYAIVHSYRYGAYFKDGSRKAEKFPSFARFYHELFERGDLIKEFSPENDNRPGPVVKVFKIN
ncbi:glycosyltransferase family 39 protein [candidate division KSB1 bacterium]|nr:glycosyltransferase family 39 protein [candidate division KSB1 bacterium]